MSDDVSIHMHVSQSRFFAHMCACAASDGAQLFSEIHTHTHTHIQTHTHPWMWLPHVWVVCGCGCLLCVCVAKFVGSAARTRCRCVRPGMCVGKVCLRSSLAELRRVQIAQFIHSNSRSRRDALLSCMQFHTNTQTEHTYIVADQVPNWTDLIDCTWLARS